MRASIGGNKLVMGIEPNRVYFNLPKDVSNNIKHELDIFIKHNELLAEHTTKKEIGRLLSKYKHGNNIHEHGKQ